MKARLNWRTASPEAAKALLALSTYVDSSSGLERSLLELVKIRASQINGCAYCIHAHTRDARQRGENEERIYLLDAWDESPVYTDRERAALAWTDALTRVAETRAPDAVYERVRRHFSEAELVNLTVAICAINSLNRIGVGFRMVPGGATARAA